MLTLYKTILYAIAFYRYDEYVKHKNQPSAVAVNVDITCVMFRQLTPQIAEVLQQELSAVRISHFTLVSKTYYGESSTYIISKEICNVDEAIFEKPHYSGYFAYSLPEIVATNDTIANGIVM